MSEDIGLGNLYYWLDVTSGSGKAVLEPAEDWFGPGVEKLEETKHVN